MLSSSLSEENAAAAKAAGADTWLAIGASSEGNSECDVRVSALPVCQGDASLLEQVFVNLVSNAFKFTRACLVTVIEAACTDGTFVVRDNGAGFGMQYAKRLFGVFQRLHSAEEFEGTGVGLSIVQRIIERHGGSIWAESAPGRGAAFRFALG